MTARGFNKGTLPDPKDHGPKGDLSLGSVLEEWFSSCIADEFYGGKAPANALIYLHRYSELAEEWEADDDRFVAMVGIIVGAFPATLSNTRLMLAGRLYRNLVEQEMSLRRYRQRQTAAQARSLKSRKLMKQEYELGKEINARRTKPLLLGQLAGEVAKKLKRPRRGVLNRLTWLYGGADTYKQVMGLSPQAVTKPPRRPRRFKR